MRLVATDLDGTIVGRDGTISARTVAALQACQDVGVHVVYVTGRPPRWMQAIVDQTGHRGTALCGNGAIVYDLDAGRVVHARILPRDVALEAARRLRDVVPDAAFAIETLTGFRRAPDYVARWDADVRNRVAPLAELVDDDPGIVKLLCRSESSVSDDMLARAIPALDGLAVPTHSNPEEGLLEVSALGVGKAAALAELAAERGIDQADVVAFGDMPNDLDMIGWAGRGYAMEGGHADVLAVAHHTAPPITEDGVAQVLEALLRQHQAPRQQPCP
jgi:Cof subfamily protein (haloacid dehalogenase superfamily)